jgi:hypothetical protein
VSAWTTSSSGARCICAESCDPMRIITTASERIDPWTRMRRSSARFSQPVSSVHAPSWADFTTITSVLKFSVHTRADGAISRNLANPRSGVASSGGPVQTYCVSRRWVAPGHIRNSSIRRPDSNFFASQRGHLPRPAQVSVGSSGFRYLGKTGGYGRRPDTGCSNRLNRSTNRCLS